MSDPLDILDGHSVQTSSDLLQYKSTSEKDYIKLWMYGNVTSYSQLGTLHACPREFQLMKHRTADNISTVDGDQNIHFAFGHAVGAGAQSYLITKDVDKSLFNCIMAWHADFNDRLDKKKKSLWEAIIAVEKFFVWWEETMNEWELLVFADGTPAIEVSFSLHCEATNKYYGHIDVICRHRFSGKIAVFELKTTAFWTGADPALYANSNQALGYSVMLETLFPGITSYEVIYCVYQALDREWVALPFTKSVLQKAEWIKDLLLDHSTIATYEQLGFYPKRGESCIRYNRHCQFFGECDIVPADKLPQLATDMEAEPVHAVIKLDDVIATIKPRRE